MGDFGDRNAVPDDDLPMIKSRRRNVRAQEEVVAVLWQFAEDNRVLQNDAKDSTGRTVSLSAVGTALDKIMRAFGYVVTSIQ
jgi:hypothetical protein